MILSSKKNSIVKIINDKYVAKFYGTKSKSILTEIKIMTMSSHPNIISGRLFPTNDEYFIGILMPKLNYSLDDLLINGKINEFIKINYLKQIACGLNYLHQNQILHLDLKLDNIMIDYDNTIKIIDFGMSEILFEENLLTAELKCTATHRPPEGFEYVIDNGHKLYSIDFAFDIWSFGIIVYEVIYGKPIYYNPIVPQYVNNETYDNQIYKFILSDEFQKEIVGSIPNKFKSCLNLDSKKRPNIDEINKILIG
jgi:serine/threonine protein kinase